MNTQLTLALRYLRGHKTRTILTTLSIVLVVMLLFGMNGMLPAIKESFSQGVKSSTSLDELTVIAWLTGSLDRSRSHSFAMFRVWLRRPDHCHAKSSCRQIWPRRISVVN